MDLLKLGGLDASPTLLVDDTFFAWGTENGQGRLKQLTAGTTANPTLLLDLQYYDSYGTPVYDEIGNILNTYDQKMGSPQTQTFTYDSINRLLSAQATGGTNGNYSESYSYNANTGNPSTGSGQALSSKTGLGTYTYGDTNHAHAVTATNSGNSYSYDDNGNQTTRMINGIGTFNLTYDAENRLVSVSGTVSASFVFDGDGNRVKSMINGTTTTFVGTYYEITGSSITKYYYQGPNRIAMRNSNGVRYLFGDHLGSTSVTADSSGGNIIRQLYTAWGEVRYSSSSLPTKYTYTGQYTYNVSGEIGLIYFVARFFDPQLGRFISADTIVPQPGSPLAWDRYLFTFGNPLKYTDPSGHEICMDDGKCYEKGKLIRTFKSAETHPIEFFLNEIFQSPIRGINDNSPCFGQARGTYFDTGNRIYHPGIDLGDELGINFYAVAPGVVVFAEDTYDLGYTIIIQHDINGVKIYSVCAFRRVW
jgi:RHS repeat-associated protein